MKAHHLGIKIDFLPEEVRRRYQVQREARRRALVLVLLVATTAAVHIWLETEVGRLRRLVASVEPAVQAEAELEQKAQALRAALERAEARARQLLARESFLPRWFILTSLAQSRPEGLWWDEIHIREEDRHPTSAFSGSSFGGSARPGNPMLKTHQEAGAKARQTVIHLVGRASEVNRVNTYLQRVQALQAVREVEVLSLQTDAVRNQPLQFELRIRWLPTASPGAQTPQDNSGAEVLAQISR